MAELSDHSYGQYWLAVDGQAVAFREVTIMAKCPECGCENADAVKFCTDCGTRMLSPDDAGPPATGATVSDNVLNRSQVDASQTSAPSSIGGINVIIGDAARHPASHGDNSAVLEPVYCGVCGVALGVPKRRCPECERYVCEEHYVLDEFKCLRCTRESERVSATTREATVGEQEAKSTGAEDVTASDMGGESSADREADVRAASQDDGTPEAEPDVVPAPALVGSKGAPSSEMRAALLDIAVPLVTCPMCGHRHNADTESEFTCKQCGAEHLCLSHMAEGQPICEACAAKTKVKRTEENQQRPREPQRKGAGRTSRDPQTPQEAANARTARVRRLLGVTAIVLAVLLMAALVWWWPEMPRDTDEVVGDTPSAAVVSSLDQGLGTGTVWKERHTGMPFYLVPAGSFLMGSPVRSVNTKAFWIGKYEVTNAEYRQFLVSSGHPEPKYWHHRRFNAPEQPVTGVSWSDAQEFCSWLSRKTPRKCRLPTEVEWEKAARGTDGRAYPWGNANPSQALAEHGGELGRGEPDPVGSHPSGASPYGCMDMAGNVWEWCADRYKNGSCALRGGCWLNAPSVLSCHFRNSQDPRVRLSGLGFRVLMEES